MTGLSDSRIHNYIPELPFTTLNFPYLPYRV